MSAASPAPPAPSAPAVPRSAAVLGAGTIGLSAGVWLAAHGVATTIVTRRAEAAAAVPAAAATRLYRLVALGALTEEQAITGRARLRAVVGPPADERFELVFEAVAEQLEVKQAVLAEAEGSVAGGGVLVTTTSSLPVAQLAAPLRRPERFAAWHWFHPADLMALVEVVPASRSDPDAVQTLVAWSTALGKRPIVLARDTPGFVANRLQYALLREAYALVESGVCSIEDVDAAVTAGLGPRWAAIGPFASMDLAGLAVHAAVAESLFGELSDRAELPETLGRLRASGAGGARDGRGLLGVYPAGRREALEQRRDRTLVLLGRGDG
jgi:3-hydroxybutyryl-CoA dehydrogenase